MRVQLAPELVSKLKKQDVRTRKSFKKAISLFLEDSDTPKLNNHELRREWKGFRSIDITSDWRAVYKERFEEEDIIAYFVALGTHKELYRRRRIRSRRQAPLLSGHSEKQTPFILEIIVKISSTTKDL